MRRGWGRLPLYQKFLTIMAVVIIIPIALLGFISYARSAVLLQEQVEEMVGQIADEVNNNIGSIVKDYDYILVQLLATPEVLEFVGLEQEEYLSRIAFSQWLEQNITTEFFLKNPYVSSFDILGANGISYSSRGTSVREYYGYYDDFLPTDGELTLFELQYQGEDSVALARRIFRGGDPAGVMVLYIKTTEMHRIWSNVDLRGGDIYILNSKQRIIYNSAPALIGQMYDEIPVSAQASESFRTSVKGVPSLCVRRHSDLTGWDILICVELDTVLQPLNSFRNFLIIIVSIMLLLSILIGYFFIRSILRPLGELKTGMKQVGLGEWYCFDLNEMPGDEIGDLMRGYNRMVVEIENLVEQVYESEKSRHKDQYVRQKAELQALQTQINPHFLYNTLGTINAYSMANARGNVQTLVDSLSAMFRYAICNPLQPVSVEDEVAHTTHYLTIQALRLSRMPQIRWEVEPHLHSTMLRLTLQPLVENVFKHAFRDGIEEGAVVTIRTRLERDRFVASVSDNGHGPSLEIDDLAFIDREADEQGGVGLSNVNRRIKLTYGEEYGLRLTGRPGLGMTTRICMPASNASGKQPETP